MPGEIISCDVRHWPLQSNLATSVLVSVVRM